MRLSVVAGAHVERERHVNVVSSRRSAGAHGIGVDVQVCVDLAGVRVDAQRYGSRLAAERERVGHQAVHAHVLVPGSHAHQHALLAPLGVLRKVTNN